MSKKAIETLLQEERVFYPPESFRSSAHVQSDRVYEEAKKDFEGFWASTAESLHWFKRWEKVLEWTPPFAKWYLGGKINACYNCVDRHISSWRRNKAAIIWEGGRVKIRC